MYEYRHSCFRLGIQLLLNPIILTGIPRISKLSDSDSSGRIEKMNGIKNE